MKEYVGKMVDFVNGEEGYFSVNEDGEAEACGRVIANGKLPLSIVAVSDDLDPEKHRLGLVKILKEVEVA